MTDEKKHPQTQGGRLLKRGDSRDPECWRTTHRLTVASSVLRSQGVVPHWPDHAEECGRHPVKLANVVHSYRERVVCTCGRDYKGPEWEPWVTGAMFDLAYKLADELQTERGGWNQAEASRAKMERDAVRS